MKEELDWKGEKLVTLVNDEKKLWNDENVEKQITLIYLLSYCRKLLIYLIKVHILTNARLSFSIFKKNINKNEDFERIETHFDYHNF